MKTKSLVLSIVVILAFFLLFIACGKSELAPMSSTMSEDRVAPAKSAKMDDKSAEMEESTESDNRDGLVKRENPALIGRKLIREGELLLEVQSIEKSRQDLEKIVQNAGGFISNTDFIRQPYRHEIKLQVRIPTKGFSDFVKTVAKLGKVENEKINVIDITDKYVDIERRVATREKLAARLEKLIESSKYAFKDLLEVERELTRIQLEIERLKGMQRGFDDRVALSTLDITLVQEVDRTKSITPPTSVFSPMVNAIENAGPRFKRSFKGLLSFFAGLINFIIVIIPWLVIIIPVILIIRWAFKKFIRLVSGQPKPKE